MIRKLADHVRQHAWFSVLVDLVVVIAGILIALEVDGWAQNRADAGMEHEYLVRLRVDLQIERDRMSDAEDFARDRIDAARLLDRVAANPAASAENPRRVIWAIETASWRSFPQINAFVYRELQSSGRLALLRSEPLRRSLAEHYTALQHDARVGEDLTTQQRFEAAVAGLLSVDELAAMEQNAGDVERVKVTPERALSLAKGLAGRPSALAELPGLVQHHIFNLRVIGQMKQRAGSIIGEIDTLLAQ